MEPLNAAAEPFGTSPLYTIQTVFNPDDPHPVTAGTESIFGIISLIFWSVTIIVMLTKLVQLGVGA